MRVASRSRHALNRATRCAPIANSLRRTPWSIQIPVQGKRTPVTLKIKFKSETLEQFIERYAVDVSQGGIFIRTKEPLAVGTQMKFEFQLQATRRR